MLEDVCDSHTLSATCNAVVQDVKRQRGHYERAALACKREHAFLNAFTERHGRVPRGVAYLPDTLVLAFDGASFGRGVPAFAQVRRAQHAVPDWQTAALHTFCRWVCAHSRS